MNHSFARLDEVYEQMEDPGTISRSSSNETHIIGRSRSPSTLSRVSSPISSLDTDDYDSDRDSVQYHEFRSPERAPDDIISSSVAQRELRISKNKTPTPELPGLENKEVMKHILRIQKDIQKITKEDIQEEYPFVEIGLFVSIGLFVLLAMNLMLQMGKQHVTYRFSSSD